MKRWLTITTSSLAVAASLTALFMATARGGRSYPASASALQQSSGKNSPGDLDRWRAAEKSIDPYGLKRYPPHPPGAPNPREPMHRFGGRGRTSYGGPTLGMSFVTFKRKMERQRAAVDLAAQKRLTRVFDLRCRFRKGVTMTRGKPIAIGPTAKLPRGIKSWQAFAKLSPEQIRKRGLFPYAPLAHPLHSTAHMLFPPSWTRVHPEHKRFDVGFDIPECFLPEFPPPLYLTTHRELGDVTRGVEITYANYFEMFNGLLTPEQMEGLRLLVTPFQTTWFNATHHRVTAKPSQGVACFSCHVNGHTNGAFELAPDSRPNYARLRVDTPSMRGNYNLMQLSSKRSIRSMDHFAEVEEYFDGDPAMQQAIGPRGAQRQITNRMGDFNSILDFPPAPKLGPLGKLIPEKASDAELRGQAIFWSKGMCFQCHSGPAFTDDYMHDLQVERFYVGRPEGPIKTFPLRGIKDTPPYLHDGRAPTLHDAVLFFDLVLELHLTEQERDDLVAFLLTI